MLKMGNNFESVKDFYANVCYTLCTRIFHLDNTEAQNPFLKLSNPAIPFLLEIPFTLLSAASKSFQTCLMLKMSGSNNVINNRDGR